jgi:hypothetical protein
MPTQTRTPLTAALPVRMLIVLAALLVSAAACSNRGASPGLALAAERDTEYSSDSSCRGASCTAEKLRLAVACTDSLADVYEVQTEPSQFRKKERGELLRCAVDRTLSVEAIESTLATYRFNDSTVRSAVRVYRIAYRTERVLGHAGLTTALVFLPDRPIARRAPLIVGAHGYMGFAEACRFSTQFDLTEKEWRRGVNAMGTLLALSSYGYPVIAPDYPWSPALSLSSEDEAHSLLDGTRAMRHLLAPGGTSDQVVLVGHSQGAHAVLSAQALAASYGLAGRLVAVVPFAPFWLPGRTLAWAISKPVGLTTADDSATIGLTMDYFYTHAELLDGQGSGLLHYQPSKRDAIARFYDQSGPCPAATEAGIAAIHDRIVALGATTSDFFQPEFLDSLGACGLSEDPDADCRSEPAASWIKRFRADRPASDPRGAEVLMWVGGRDAASPPSLAQCGIDKITSDFAAPGATAELTVCADRDADHETLLSNNVAWTARWIASRTLGAAAPESCPTLSSLPLAPGETLDCPGIPTAD